MNRKHRTLITIVAILTTIYMVFNAFYEYLYGYFNIHGELSSFLTTANLIWWFILIVVALCGLTAVRDQAKKIIPFYLIFFLMNLLSPYIFR